MKCISFLSLFLILFSCQEKKSFYHPKTPQLLKDQLTVNPDTFYIKKAKTIHVHVALCDNKSQGIAPVPDRIGDGNQPDENLYWGCGYGIKRFFTHKINDWVLIAEEQNSQGTIMERLLFKKKGKEVYLLADAYRGSEIQKCTMDFFEHNAGTASFTHKNQTFGGASDLNVYVGHNPLMDFYLEKLPQDISWNRREAMVFACNSRYFFEDFIGECGSNLILGTQQFMAPEAYSVHAAVNAWINNESPKEIAKKASMAYHEYQRNCPLSWANNIFGVDNK